MWVVWAEHEAEPKSSRPRSNRRRCVERPVQISQAGEQPLSPKVVVNSNGDAAVTSGSATGTGRRRSRAATRPAGGAWSQPWRSPTSTGIPPNPTSRSTHRQRGRRLDHRTAEPIWICSNRHPSRRWCLESARGAFRRSAAAAVPRLAADSEGNLTAIWDLGGEEGAIQFENPAGGQRMELPQRSTQFDEDGLSSSPRIATDDQGDDRGLAAERHPGASGFHYFVQTARLKAVRGRIRSRSRGKTGSR